MVGDAKLNMQDLHKQWETYWKAYCGRHEDGLRLESWQRQDFVPMNFIFSHTESLIPILLDAAPAMNVVAVDEANDARAEALTEALQALWSARDIATELETALRDSAVLGTGFLKVWWDQTLGPLEDEFDDDGRVTGETRLGDVNVSWLDPWSVYPDPTARNIEECEYIALASNLSPERARRLFDKFDEKKGELLTPDGQTATGMWARARLWAQNVWTAVTQGQKPMAREVYRIWEVYHEGGQRLTIFSGDHILYDGDSPIASGKYPVVAFPTYQWGHDFWGLSEASQIWGLQRLINLTNMRITTHARLTGNAPWVTDDRDARVSNEPGAKCVHRPGSALRREPPPPLPNYFFNWLQFQRQTMDTITGLHDVMRGLSPGSVQSGIGIQQLQESALVRPRHKTRMVSRALQQVGALMLELMQARYGEERTIPYLDGTQPATARVTPDMLYESLGMAQAPEEGMMLGMEEGLEQVPEMSLSDDDWSSPIEYKVVVQPGGELPLNPMAHAEMSLRLIQTPDETGQPVIDGEAVLDALNFRGRREVMRRKQERLQGSQMGQTRAMLM